MHELRQCTKMRRTQLREQLDEDAVVRINFVSESELGSGGGKQEEEKQRPASGYIDHG